jgi:hypothetical protein
MNSAQTQIPNSAAVSANFAPTDPRKSCFFRNWKWLGSMVLVVRFGLALALALAAPSFSSSTNVVTASGQSSAIQTQETNQEGVVAELTECQRHEGVLTIKIRFRNTSNKAAVLTLTHYNSDDSGHFYVTAGNKKYFMLKDSEGIYLSSISASNGVEAKLEPGQTYLFWAKYPAPTFDVKKINFITPVTPPFEDVPITDK